MTLDRRGHQAIGPWSTLPSQFADDLPTIEKRLCKCLI